MQRKHSNEFYTDITVARTRGGFAVEVLTYRGDTFQHNHAFAVKRDAYRMAGKIADHIFKDGELDRGAWECVGQDSNAAECADEAYARADEDAQRAAEDDYEARDYAARYEHEKAIGEEQRARR